MIKNIRVTVDGKPYEVTVEIPDEAPPPTAAPASAAPAPTPKAVAAAPKPAAPPPAAAGPGDIPSPLAGHVVGVTGKPGDVVKKGDPILSIEAMKMNTFVLAPQDGKITAVHVKPGDVVTEGQALARVE